MMRISWLALCFVASTTAFQVGTWPRLAHRRGAPVAVRASIIDVEENAVRDIGTMQEWALYNGVQTVDGFQLTMSEDGLQDFGVMTTQDIPANTPVLMVPQPMIFSANLARQELYNDSVQKAEEYLDRHQLGDSISEFALYLKILTEIEQGEQSPWFPWFNSLPRRYYNGASMTPFCFRCLPPLAQSLARAERSKNIYFRDALRKLDFLSEDTKVDRELCTWAFQIVCTRSFETADGDRRIVPMADMFDHTADPEIVLDYDEEGNCYAYAIKDVPAGYPLRMSYGDPTNPSQFLARFGFFDDACPATFCKILINNPSEQLVNMGYDPSQMLFWKDTGDISQEVYDVVLYQFLGREDRETQNAFYEAHMNGDLDTKSAIHEHYAEDTLGVLSRHVDDFLRELDDLLEKAESRDAEDHPRLPMIQRHNEFVKETFQRVQACLNEFAVSYS